MYPFISGAVVSSHNTHIFPQLCFSFWLISLIELQPIRIVYNSRKLVLLEINEMRRCSFWKVGSFPLLPSKCIPLSTVQWFFVIGLYWFPWYWTQTELNNSKIGFVVAGGGFYSYYNLKCIKLDKGKKNSRKNKFYAYQKHLMQFLKNFQSRFGFNSTPTACMRLNDFFLNIEILRARLNELFYY